MAGVIDVNGGADIGDTLLYRRRTAGARDTKS
jgi:hypothetical protein